MAARTTMDWLIARIRRTVNDTESDTWTDDLYIQELLDQQGKVIIRRSKLHYDVDKKIYVCDYGMLEGTYWNSDLPSAVWDDDNVVIKIWDSPSAAAAAIIPDHWNLASGEFWWDSDQSDEYYLDARAYNIYWTMGDMMMQVATDRSKPHQLTRGGVSQMSAGPLTLATKFYAMGGTRGTKITRTYRTNR